MKWDFRSISFISKIPSSVVKWRLQAERGFKWSLQRCQPWRFKGHRGEQSNFVFQKECSYLLDRTPACHSRLTPTSSTACICSCLVEIKRCLPGGTPLQESFLLQGQLQGTEAGRDTAQQFPQRQSCTPGRQINQTLSTALSTNCTSSVLIRNIR